MNKILWGNCKRAKVLWIIAFVLFGLAPILAIPARLGVLTPFVAFSLPFAGVFVSAGAQVKKGDYDRRIRREHKPTA